MRFAPISIISLVGLAVAVPQDGGRRLGDPNNPYDYNTIGDYAASVVESTTNGGKNPERLLGGLMMAYLIGLAQGMIATPTSKPKINPPCHNSPFKVRGRGIQPAEAAWAVPCGAEAHTDQLTSVRKT
jgi:hypothetical protein